MDTAPILHDTDTVRFIDRNIALNKYKQVNNRLAITKPSSS